MAVQAQYPSNVLLLNRDSQEGNNPLLDQSHMIFTNGVGTNPRKRGREITSTRINPFSFQIQPSQFIDLTQIHTPQPNVVSTGLQLAFGDQTTQQQQQREHTLSPQLQPQHTLSQRQSSALSSLISEELAGQIRQQREEMEQFLQAQGEQLRRTLAEKRQRHYRALIGAAEESAARRLREKEAEVEKVARRNSELEAKAAQICLEAQGWQARARAEEATAASLQEQLQQAIMGGGQRRDWGEEVGCCGGGEAENAESAYVDPDRVAAAASVPSCKACRRRVASVVVLPCRHLCLCTECDGVAQACPLCLSFRESSVEVFVC